MSRSCLAEEETILPYVDELLRKQTPYEARSQLAPAPAVARIGSYSKRAACSRASQVGLLIGKLAVGSRDLLYAVVKTDRKSVV